MSTKKTSGLYEGVFDAIHTVMHLHRAAVQREMHDVALTHMEHKTLGFFTRHPGATLSDLVARTGRDKAQLARIVKDLKDKGLLEGSADENDRRSTRLTASAAGLALHDRVREYAKKVNQRGVAGLSEAECEMLQILLDRVRGNLETPMQDAEASLDAAGVQRRICRLSIE